MDVVEGKIQSCEAILGYTFNDKRLLCEALQTSGNPIPWQGVWTTIPKNTRLAVYGDAILNVALCRLWLPTDLKKGDWTTIRNLGQNSNLAAVGFQHGLDACVILDPGTPRASGASMATTIEAVIGAVEKDGGSESLIRLLTRLGLIHSLLTPE